jgi:hypothetical protein
LKLNLGLGGLQSLQAKDKKLCAGGARQAERVKILKLNFKVKIFNFIKVNLSLI